MLKRENHNVQEQEMPQTPTPSGADKKKSRVVSEISNLRTPLKQGASFDFISPRRPDEEEDERRKNRTELVKKQHESREALRSPASEASPRAEPSSALLTPAILKRQGSNSSNESINLNLHERQIISGSSSFSSRSNSNSNSILTAAVSKSKLSRSTTKLSSSQPPKILSAEQMTKSFDEWMKMAADNKINSKNSWNFALIDYFSELTFLRDGDDSINFQKASFTLDGCVKIYGSRVDSVVDETTKLLNGLTDKTFKLKSLEEEEEENENDDFKNDQQTHQNDHKTTISKIKRSTTRTVETIEKNVDNLILKNFELEFSIDPLFKKTSAEFDETGSKGSLLKTLEISPIDNLVIFDSSDQIPIDFNIKPDRFEDSEIDELIDISSLMISLDDFNIEYKSLCPTFENYSFNSNSNSFEIRETLDKLSKLTSTFNQIEPVAEVQRELEEVEEEFNDGNDKFIENDMNYFNEDGHDYGEQEQGLEANDNDDDKITKSSYSEQKSKTIKWAASSELKDETSLSYFDGAMKQTWAGPEHWKIRRSQRIGQNSIATANTIVNNNKTTLTSTRKASKTEKAAIDFINSIIDFRQIFSKPSNSNLISLNKAAILERNEQDHLLPNDLHFSSASLLKLFIKPTWKMEINNKTDQDLNSGSKSRPRSSSRIGVTSEQTNFVEREFWISQESSRKNGVYQLSQKKIQNDDENFSDDDDENILRINYNGDNNEVNLEMDLGVGNDDSFFSHYEEVLETNSCNDNNNVKNITNTENNNSLTTQVDFKQNLVAPPKFTYAPQLNYARTAKRVDVAKLKATLWNNFLENSNKTFGNENLKEATNKQQFKGNNNLETSSSNNSDTNTNHNTLSFSNLINNLSKSYPSEALADVSVPYCFICLLHLANENNLEIKPTADSDLIIFS